MKDSQDGENNPYRFKSSHSILFCKFRPIQEFIRLVSSARDGIGDEAVKTIQDDVNLKRLISRPKNVFIRKYK